MADGESNVQRPESSDTAQRLPDQQHVVRSEAVADTSSPIPSPVQSGQEPKPATSDTPVVVVTASMEHKVSSGRPPLDKQPNTPRSTTDRVFPAKSLIGIDPTQPPQSPPGRTLSTGQGHIPLMTVPAARSGESVAKVNPNSARHAAFSSSNTEENYNPQVRQPEPHVFLEGLRSDRKGSILEPSATPDTRGDSVSKEQYSSSPRDRMSAQRESISGLVTSRFKHVITDDGHAIITGRDGEPLTRCEDEPIHIPGAVQAFGLLIALEEKEDDQLIVRIVSENSHRIIGYTPRELFKLNSFCDILSEDQQDNLLDHIDFIRDEDTDPASNGPDVFTVSVLGRNPPKRNLKLWCAMHISPSHEKLIICEFELDNDDVYPLVPSSEIGPESPEDTLNCDPTDEEYIESTFNPSKPLRVLRNARKQRGEAAAVEVYNIMSQVQDQLASAPNLEKFLKILVGVVKELTGFHRVMIYQFDSNFDGRVVTELVDPRATKDLYRGLNFPASDIPKQARDLYKINKVRLLYDRDLQTARLVCRSVDDLEKPLDLTFSILRAMSPIHIKYLANMAVRSSMSISINAFDELWGLVSCHSYGSNGMRVSFPIRNMCRLVGDTASRNIERLSYASRLQARKLINTVPTEPHPSGYIVVSSDDLLELFNADFGILTIRKEAKILGHLEQSQEALVMLEYLRMRKIASVTASQDIREDFPDLQYPPGFSIISGLLLVPLDFAGDDFIVFFRRSQTREVKWAGNPYEKVEREGTNACLEPRQSFKTWTETVAGKCSEWTEEQVETAAVLCLVYGKFIKVWREEEAAMERSKLTQLLLSNSAHEVRTPLNAIINYLEIALEGTIDQETRDNLSRSHSASKSLIYVINDLLDLTKAEDGQDLINDEIFDFIETMREVMNSFKSDANRKGLQYEVIEHSRLPRLVYGDQRSIRQAISNIIANAIDNTTTGWVRVEAWLEELLDSRATIEVSVEDTGAGISNKRLDALFRDLEQVSTEGRELFGGMEIGAGCLAKNRGDSALGLGLAVVARVVRNMNGQLRLKSEEGSGSRFVIQLPFSLPEGDEQAAGGDENSSHTSTVGTSRRHVSMDEITLIDKGSPHRIEGETHKRSWERRASLRSFRSRSSRSNKSNESNVDRMVNEIHNPLGKQTKEDVKQSSNVRSKGHGKQKMSSLGHTAIAPIPTPLGNPPNLPGFEALPSQKTLIKAVRMPEESPQPELGEVALYTKHKVPRDGADKKEDTTMQLHSKSLQILVAEDDPINSRIIKKRLEKSGHTVHLTVNGEECAASYQGRPEFFDVVLMDMQMPIVDGAASTEMIRLFEKKHSQDRLSSRTLGNGRVPIFVVSASLVEREQQQYINTGFDGWVLKPIDFQRLNTLLAGIVEDDARKACQYHAGEWERGGWFQKGGVFVQSPSKSDSDDLVRHQSAEAQLEMQGTPPNNELSKLSQNN